jgi:hypothetical protein
LDWGTDEAYPAGFRYKLLSALNKPADTIELLIILQQRDGSKEVLKHYDVNAPAFDRFVATFVEGLAEKHEIAFELQDFRSCDTLEKFEAHAASFGWLDGGAP